MTVGDGSAVNAVLAISAGGYKRQCWGDLFLADAGLYFVCYADRMAIGSVVPTLNRRAAVAAQLKGSPLDEAVAHNQYSLRFALADVNEFKKTFWMGQSFRAAGTRYQFVHGLGKADRQRVRTWCEAHSIPCPGF